MNRLLRRFGVRSWDGSAGIDSHRASALSGNETDASSSSTGRAPSDAAERSQFDLDLRVALSGSAIARPGPAMPVSTCHDAQRRTNPAQPEDLHGVGPRQVPLPGTGADRRWAAIGRGTPDLSSAAAYGHATSAEVGR
ncbi:hypothetical protein ABZV58_09515 [Nocardia sp. NPDC004654]|uniref:hypothetical protein n=1 Tax=Nocardia sp. NPDC004654 TaxID=3154776 RepID=UPI0033BD6596